jgi:large subunit ribosomal protein L5
MNKARLQVHYEEKIRKALVDNFDLKNVMQVPRLEKIVVNMGIGEAVANSKVVEKAVADLFAITGQKPVVTKAKKSIAGFKLRKGMPIGCKVTLRGNMMWEFLDRFTNIALPRVRDFRGISPKQFDGKGNFSMGLREHSVFVEVDYDKVDIPFGMNIVIVTSADNDEMARSLLQHLDLPFNN